MLLTRDCVGNYKLMELEDSLVYQDGTEGSEEDRKKFQVWMKRPGVVKVDKASAKNWEVGGLDSFCPAGCLRNVVYKDEDKVTVQHWIEGNNLVTRRFLERVDSEETVKFEFRVVITFYKNKFVYKKRSSITTNGCENGEYKVEASFAKIE